jgi:Ca2+-transporting ATPase
MSETGSTKESQGSAAVANPVSKTSELPVYAMPVEDFLASLAVRSSDGLTQAEVERRLKEYGPNRLPEGKKKSALLRLLEQF